MPTRAALLILLLTLPLAARADDAPPATPAQLFVQDKVWTIYLTFTPDEWKAMEPPEGKGIFSLMFGGNRDTLGADPAKALATAMLHHGDVDHDGRLTRNELGLLAGRWFDRWDFARAGALDRARVEYGLDGMIDPEGTSRPGGGFPISLRAADGKRNGLSAALGVEFHQSHATLEFAGQRFDDVAVRYKGNGTFTESRKLLKRSFKIELNQFVKGQRLAGVTKLNLHNNVSDPGEMNEPLAYALYRDAGVPAPRTAYAKVFVTVPGLHDRRYLGLYSIVENADEHFAAEQLGTRKGALFKPVTPAGFADLGDDWKHYKQTYDAKNPVTEAQTARVMELARFVTWADDATFAARLGEFFDVDQLARFMSVTSYLSALDSILFAGQNYVLHLHPRTGRFQLVPWDMDHAFGEVFQEQEELVRLPIMHPWVGQNRFVERVFKTEAFRVAYAARTTEFTATLFDPKRFHAQVDALAKVLRSAIEQEGIKSRLAEFDKTVAGGPIKAARGFFAPRPTKSIKGFVDVRTPEVLAQLAGKSTGEPGKGLQFGGNRKGVQVGPYLAPMLLAALDADKDGRLTRAEMVAGFDRWFTQWDADGDGQLSDAELRAGTLKAFPLPATRPTTRPATAPAATSPTPATSSAPR